MMEQEEYWRDRTSQETQMMASGLLPRDHPLFAEMRQLVARDREMGLSSTDATLAEAMLRHYGEELDVLPSLFDLGAQNPMAQQIEKLKRLKGEQEQQGAAKPLPAGSSSPSSSSSSSSSGGSRLDVVLEDLLGELTRQQAKADSSPSSSLASSSSSSQAITPSPGNSSPQPLRPIYPPLKDLSRSPATVVAGGQRQQPHNHQLNLYSGQRWASDDVLGGKLDYTPRSTAPQTQQEVTLIDDEDSRGASSHSRMQPTQQQPRQPHQLRRSSAGSSPSSAMSPATSSVSSPLLQTPAAAPGSGSGSWTTMSAAGGGFGFPTSPVAVRAPRIGSPSVAAATSTLMSTSSSPVHSSPTGAGMSPMSSPLAQHHAPAGAVTTSPTSAHSPVPSALSPPSSSSSAVPMVGDASSPSASSENGGSLSPSLSSSGSTSTSSHSKALPEELVELITAPTVASIGAGLQFIKKHNYQHHHHPHHYHHHHHHQGHLHPNRALHKSLPEKKAAKNKGVVSIGWVHRERENKEEEGSEDRPRIPLRRARHKSTPSGLAKSAETSHLSAMALGVQYMQLYRNHMYIFDPLHPVVLDENKIRFYLCTTEGVEERSTFAFSMNVMFCIGSMLFGDHKSSVEFRMRAEDLLNYLCQVPSTANDYSFATGLTALSFNTLYWEMNNAKSADYLRMAINTCKRLQALNSDAYSRCLYALSFHPFTELADIQNLKKELEIAKKLPYVPVTTTNTPCTPGDVQNWQRLVPVSVENLHIANAALGVISNLISGLILYKANASRFAPKANQSTLLHFLEAITALEAEIDLIQSNAPDTFPKPTSKFIKFYIFSLRAECHWMLEDKETALKWAEAFLAESIKPDSKYAVAGVSQLIGIVLNIFLRMEKYDLLNMQLQGLEEWAKLIPIVRTIQFNYLKELEQILRRTDASASASASTNGGGSGNGSPVAGSTADSGSQSSTSNGSCHPNGNASAIFTITENEIEMLKENDAQQHQQQQLRHHHHHHQPPPPPQSQSSTSSQFQQPMARHHQQQQPPPQGYRPPPQQQQHQHQPPHEQEALHYHQQQPQQQQQPPAKRQAKQPQQSISAPTLGVQAGRQRFMTVPPANSTTSTTNGGYGAVAAGEHRQSPPTTYTLASIQPPPQQQHQQQPTYHRPQLQPQPQQPQQQQQQRGYRQSPLRRANFGMSSSAGSAGSGSTGGGSAEDLGRSLESADFDLFAEVAREMEGFRMNNGEQEVVVPSVVVNQQLHSSGGASSMGVYDWAAAISNNNDSSSGGGNAQGIDPTMVNPRWL